MTFGGFLRARPAFWSLRYLGAARIDAVLSIPGLLAVHDLVQDARRDLSCAAAVGTRRESSSNYYVLFKDGDVMAIGNSLVLAGISSVFAMIFGTLCAYSLARFNTGGENLAMWIISQRMIPPIAVVFPIFLIYVYFGLVDTYFGLILLYTAFNLPYVIWMMRGYIVDIPLELEESALVDGLNRWEVIWKVVFPMARSGSVATAVFTFVFAWNDFLFALVLTRTEVITFPVQLTHYFGGQSNFWSKIAAMSVLGTIPDLYRRYADAALSRARHLAWRSQRVGEQVADVRISGLHKYYGTVHAVKGIDLPWPMANLRCWSVRPAAARARFCAPSRASRNPTSGNDRNRRQDRQRDPPTRPQYRDGVSELRALSLSDGLRKHCLWSAGAQDAEVEIKKRVGEAAECSVLRNFWSVSHVSLSGGQRQRVAIGRAIVRKAQLFLFDEPLSNLDATAARRDAGEIKRLHHEITPPP